MNDNPDLKQYHFKVMKSHNTRYSLFIHCLICFSLLFSFCLLVTSCSSGRYKPLSVEDRDSLRNIVLIISETGPHDRAIYDCRVGIQGGGCRVLGGYTAKYKKQFNYISSNLPALLPDDERCPARLPEYISSSLSKQKSINTVLPSENTRTIWNRKSEKSFVNAIDAIRSDLIRENCDTVLDIKIKHQVVVDGVYVAFCAYMLKKDRPEPMVYERIIFSPTIPINLDCCTSDGLFLESSNYITNNYPKKYREFINSSVDIVMSDITGIK